MSWDVNELVRLLAARGIECSVTGDNHQVRFTAPNGDKCVFYGHIYGGRDAMMTLTKTFHGVTPQKAIEVMMYGGDVT